jgi:23S rRNA pseudouridine1911/1915/1917 synthase
VSIIELTITEPGERLDKLVTTLLAEQASEADGRAYTPSRGRVQQLIKDGGVTVNGKPGKASYRVEMGDRLTIDPPPPPPAAPEFHGEAIPLEVLYEDAEIAAINKPAGMVVHPAAGHTGGTLVNAVLGRWPQTAGVGDPGRAGIVHRLDKDTSGVILIAKTESARRKLVAQFKARKIQKRYLALVRGIPATPTGEIDAPIGRDPRQRKRMAVVRDGRESITLYHVLQTFDDLSFLELFPKTGRTHQLRVHLAFIRTPVVGDTVYGFRKTGLKSATHLKRQFLHAESLTLTSPLTGEPLTIHAPLAPELQAIIDDLMRSQSQPTDPDPADA